METPITVTQCELLSLMPKVQTQLADATVQRQVPQDPAVQAMHRTLVAHAIIEKILNKDNPDSMVLNTKDSIQLLHMPAAFTATVRV